MYMTKDSYREYFANVKRYVKFRPFLTDLNIVGSQFSLFMRGSDYNWTMSVEKLDCLYNLVHDTLKKIA